MEMLVWDDSLAAASAKWAEQCVWAHDPDNSANRWGENLAASWLSLPFSREQLNVVEAEKLVALVQAWYDEAEDAVWLADGTGVSPKARADPERQCRVYDANSSSCMIGHYTQVVWAETNRIGCAAVACANGTLLGHGGMYLVCKYTPAGNVRLPSGSIGDPWMAGATCAACADTCVGGKLCGPGRAPTRCNDTISLWDVRFDSVSYADCRTLTEAVPSWCTGDNYEGRYGFCQDTCGACSVPDNVGPEFCTGTAAVPYSSATEEPEAIPPAEAVTSTPEVNFAPGAARLLVVVALLGSWPPLGALLA